MGETSIEWADYTFNPWIGCEKVSTGCKNCYASVDTYARVSASRGLPLWGPGSSRHRTSAANWRKPLAWNRKARASRLAREVLGVSHARPRVFCASMADVFEARPDLDPWRADLFALIEETPELDWLLLTKRPENVREMVPAEWLGTGPVAESLGLSGMGWPSTVWLGTSVEDQEQAEARIPHLLAVPALVRFLSLEPLLGPVDLSEWTRCKSCGYTLEDAAIHLDHRICGDTIPSGLHWLIIGGESGDKARTCDVAWIRDLVRQGREAGEAVFVKQLGACFSDPVHGIAGRSLVVPQEAAPLVARRLVDPKGGDMAEWPEDLRVRVIPASVVA